MIAPLLSSDVRALVIAIAAVAGLLSVVAIVRRWRAPIATPIMFTALLSLLVVVGEQLIAWLVASQAPAATDFNQVRWVVMAPWGRALIVFGLVASAVVVALAWITTSHVKSPVRRSGIVMLRSMAAAAALFLFLEPAVELRQVTREPNRVAVLVDDSRSMSLRDDPSGPTRSERAAELMSASQSTFDAWRGKHNVDVYRFSSDVLSAEKNDLGLSANGPATLIRQALEKVRARYDGADLAGMVLVSDGIATGEFAGEAGLGQGPNTTDDFVRDLQTKVHTVWAARPGLVDIAVADVGADEFAFVRTVFKIKATIRSTGFAGKRAQVVLSREGRPMRQKWVDIDSDTHTAKVEFEFTPSKVGRYVYTIETPVLDGETVTENNRRSFVLRVIRDKIRVLQVAGQPSWDVRALRGMLKQNPNVDLISFFILRTLDDISNASDAELSLIPFPTRELFMNELPSFDVVVFQNFNFGPFGISPFHENIRRYVETGGALAVIGGDRAFSSGGYGGTPVAKALPVKVRRGGRSLLVPKASSDLLDVAPFQAKLTDAGRAHPITALRYDSVDNAKTWASLPPLEGMNLTLGATRDSVVLATHPRHKTRGGKPMPLIVAGEYGEGRTLAITTDSLWRWGFVAAAEPGNDGRHYLKLWENITRWLIDDPDLRYLRVDSDRVEYAPGERARIEVRVLGRDYKPRKDRQVLLEITRQDDDDKSAPVAVDKVSVTTDEGGRAAHVQADLTPGIYRVVASAADGGRDLSGKDIFLVRRGTDELARPAGESGLLEQIAAASEGRFFGSVSAIPPDLPLLPPRIVRVDNRTDVELWSRPMLLFIALMCLGLEWLLRQKRASG